MKHKLLTTILIVAALVITIPTGAAQTKEQRVKFGAEKSSAVVRGAIRDAESQFYVLRAKAGQTLSVSVASPNEAIQIVAVRQRGGEWEDANLTGEWSGEVPAAGDYEIEIGIADGAPNGKFTLKVSVK